MNSIPSSHSAKSKIHEGIEVNESEPNITRRRFVTHPNRGMVKSSPTEIKAFLLESIDASDQLMKKHYELLSGNESTCKP